MKKTTLTFLSILAGVTQVVWADAPANPTDAINALSAGYGYNQQSMMLMPPFAFAQELTSTNQLSDANITVNTTAAQSAEELLKKYTLSANPTPKDKDTDKGPTQASVVVAEIPTTTYHDPKATPDNKNLSAGTIIDTLQYHDQQKSNEKDSSDKYTSENASNFVMALLHLGGTNNLQPPQNTGTISPNSSLAIYLANYNAYAAAQSVAASVLNHMVAERQPIKNLGCAAGVAKQADCQGQSGYAKYNPPPTATLPADISPLRLSHFIATSRLQPEWRVQMSVGSTPAQIQKETLMVLADIEYMMYQLHMDNERMLALLAATQIQNSVNYRNTALVNQQSANPSNSGTTINPIANQVKSSGVENKQMPKTPEGAGA